MQLLCTLAVWLGCWPLLCVHGRLGAGAAGRRCCIVVGSLGSAAVCTWVLVVCHGLLLGILLQVCHELVVVGEGAGVGVGEE